MAPPTMTGDIFWLAPVFVSAAVIPVVLEPVAVLTLKNAAAAPFSEELGGATE